MNNEKHNKHISKFLSLILRHKPETIGITLDQNGWTEVEELILKANEHGVHFDLETLKSVVATNNKKRFAFDATFEKIRASQGHSVNIDLAYENTAPPEILFHGTAEKNLESILENGLQKRSRQHVHLSKDQKTAIQVGQRHGKPVVLRVMARQMFENNHEFYLSENGVWLTEEVPVEFLVV